ncbi:flagellar protein FlhE [Halomonas sp.]|uniref:flagellar protein FlhE n=1 Tax=Halomonas TaxID=2745 RepID=UPI00105E3EE6
MKRYSGYCLLLLLALACGELQAAGSWVATAPPVRVSLTGRDTASDALRPSTSQARGHVIPRGHVIQSIVWRYRHPPGSRVNVRLCHPAGCTPLANMRGTTRALAGSAADAPLEFRFSLPEGQRPVTVGGLQVIVNYR